MARTLENIRNIGIIAHIDAGKTTVTERMLFFTGEKHRVGRVDQGTAECDDDEEEQNRGITIYSACVTFEWGKCHFNLLDTPGHVDFTAEVERCLRVLDGAVVVFSAREGVEAQSETVWRQANRYDVPRLAFINKMDREGADFSGTLDEIRERLGAEPVAVNIPVGQGPAHVNDPFRALIDLIEMQLVEFDTQSDGLKFRNQEIPDGLRDEADFWRDRMLETLYRFSDEMMELALAEKPIPADLIRQVLRSATLHMQIQPVLCGTALHGIGVQPLLDAVSWYLPSPKDRPPVEGIDPKGQSTKGQSTKGSSTKGPSTKGPSSKGPSSKGTSSKGTSSKDLVKLETRKPNSKEPFCGLVFKILPAKTGDLYWVRVYSGELKANSRAYNPDRDKKENISQLWQIHATKKERDGQVDRVATGDIVGVIGPRHSITGDTLCDPRHPVMLPSIQFADAVISMAIEPESSAERKKLSSTLEMLKRQDPTFRAAENEETGQTIISGMGELHLEVIKHRLLREFDLDVKVHNPRVSFRETVEHAAEVTGECNRHVAGKQLFARLKVRLEHAPDGAASVQVLTSCPPDVLPPELLAVAIEELASCGAGGGPIGSFPLTQLKITVLGGEAHPDNSDEVAFRIAASDAFERGLQASSPVLLEPIMKLDIFTPESHLGDIVGDLQQRRATICGNENRGVNVVIEAHAPLRELFGYANALRSASQGRAACSMEPLHYAAAPSDVAKQYLM